MEVSAAPRAAARLGKEGRARSTAAAVAVPARTNLHSAPPRPMAVTPAATVRHASPAAVTTWGRAERRGGARPVREPAQSHTTPAAGAAAGSPEAAPASKAPAAVAART